MARATSPRGSTRRVQSNGPSALIVQPPHASEIPLSAADRPPLAPPADVTAPASPDSDVRWRGGRHPGTLSSGEFMALYRTGFIESHVYDAYAPRDGLRWLGTPARYPLLVETLMRPCGPIAFRQSGEINRYVAHDANGEIACGTDGLALYCSDAEVVARGWPLYDTTLVAFHDKLPVGFVANEWGATGVWVTAPYQRQGIGTELLLQYLTANPRAALGQMTDAGAALARAVHRRFVHAATHLAPASPTAPPASTACASAPTARRVPA